jgi:hypothetical protein
MNREADDLIQLEELAEVLRVREGPPTPRAHIRHSPRRRLAVAAVLAAVAVTGIALAIVTRGGGEQAPSSSGGREQTLPSSSRSSAASCAAVVEWHGTRYLGTKVKGPVKLGRSLGDGTIPPCNDTGGDNGGTPAARSVPLVAGDRLSPDEVVAVAGDPSIVYISPG